MEAFLKILSETKKENTVSSYRRVLSDLARHHAPRALSDLTEADLKAYFSLLAESVSAVSLGHSLSVVRSYYRFLMGNENPMERIRARDFSVKEKKLLSKEELALLLGSFSDGVRGIRDEAMIALLLETGIRVSELVGLSRSDLSPDESIVFCGEGEKKRRLAVSADTMERLRKYRTLSGVINPEEEALFLGPTGKRLTRQGFWRNLKDRAEKFGIEDCTPARLRQSLAKEFLSRGLSRVQVKSRLGIQSEARLRQYEKQIKERNVWDF